MLTQGARESFHATVVSEKFIPIQYNTLFRAVTAFGPMSEIEDEIKVWLNTSVPPMNFTEEIDLSVNTSVSSKFGIARRIVEPVCNFKNPAVDNSEDAGFQSR